MIEGRFDDRGAVDNQNPDVLQPNLSLHRRRKLTLIGARSLHPELAVSEPAQDPTSENAPRGFLVALVVLAALVFTAFHLGTWRQYLDGQVRGDAVQVFNAMLSRFAAGEGMIHVHSGNHFFKNHVMLWLYPVGWLYMIHDSLFTYLAPLNAALALAVIPLGLLAWHRTRCRAVSLALCVFFAVSNLTASMRLSVHPESLLIPGWFLLFWAAETRRHRLMIVAVALILLVKEDQPIWLAVYALWGLVFRRNERRPAIFLLAASVVSYIVFKLIMFGIPLTGKDQDIGYFWLKRFGDVAETPGQLAVWFLTHPHLLLARVAVNPTWLFIIASGGIVCLLGWREMLLTLPPAFFLFSAVADEFRLGLYYYLYPILPAVMFAAVAGCAALVDAFGKHRATKPAVLGGLAVMVAIQFLLPTRVDGWHQLPPRLPREVRSRLDAARNMVQRAVPRDATNLRAAVHYDLNMWVPRGRQLLFLREEDLPQADVIILDRTRVSADLGRDKYIDLLRALLNDNPDWRIDEDLGQIDAHWDGLMVLRRRKP